MWVWFPEGQEGLVAQLRRATVQKVDDSGDYQILKKLTGLASESPEDLLRPQSHGFSSHPPKDSEGLFLALGGRSDRLIGIGFEHKKKRIKNLAEGAAVLYDAEGNVVYAKMGDGVVIEAKKGKVTVKPESGKFVFLGGDGSAGTYGFVETDAGTSMNVKARVS